MCHQGLQNNRNVDAIKLLRTSQNGKSSLGGEAPLPGRVQYVYLVCFSSYLVEFSVEIFTCGLILLLKAVSQEPAQDGGLPNARRAEHHYASAVLRFGGVGLVCDRLETRVAVQNQCSQLIQRRLFVNRWMRLSLTGRAHHPRLLLLLFQLRRGQLQDAHSCFGERADCESGRAESLCRVFVGEQDAW